MAAEVSTDTPYGIIPALQQGGFITVSLFTILIIMSAGSWYIMLTGWFSQRKMLKQARIAESKVWSAGNLQEGLKRLDNNSPFKQIADDGIRAFRHHEEKEKELEGDNKITRDEWVTMAFNRSAGLISSRLAKGLSFLASVGSVAPFIGLLGTVIGIYRALINIGMAGQASIDKVAGPVGEALIMTALGLFVAVPAVLGYNDISGRNKSIMERLNVFAADVHSYLFSGTRVKREATVSAAAKKVAPAAAGKPVAK